MVKKKICRKVRSNKRTIRGNKEFMIAKWGKKYVKVTRKVRLWV